MDRKPQRSTFHTWAFAQLGAYLAYKTTRAGVAFTQVDPRNTSRECSACGHLDKKNRVNQACFACLSCGVSLHADHNAALNIAARGHHTWGPELRVRITAAGQHPFDDLVALA